MELYVLRTESRGELCFIETGVDLNGRTRVVLTVEAGAATTFRDRENAERWAKRVERRDPSLAVTVVTV